MKFLFDHTKLHCPRSGGTIELLLLVDILSAGKVITNGKDAEATTINQHIADEVE